MPRAAIARLESAKDVPSFATLVRLSEALDSIFMKNEWQNPPGWQTCRLDRTGAPLPDDRSGSTVLVDHIVHRHWGVSGPGAGPHENAMNG